MAESEVSALTYKLTYLNANGDGIDFGLNSGYVIGSITGLTTNIINMPTSQGTNQVGVSVQGRSVQGKDIVVTGVLMGDTIEKRKHMLDVILPQVPARLIFNDKYEVTGEARITPDITRHMLNAGFSFTVFLPLPYWRRTEQTVTTLAGLEKLFRFPWNISKTFSFSKRTATFYANAINGGNVPASFTLYFRANTAVDTPMITNVETGDFIRINKSMVIGEIIVINMIDVVTVTSIVQGISTDILGYLDMASELFQLKKGDNLIRYDASINRDGLDCWIISQDTLTGVSIDAF